MVAMRLTLLVGILGYLYGYSDGTFLDAAKRRVQASQLQILVFYMVGNDLGGN